MLRMRHDDYHVIIGISICIIMFLIMFIIIIIPMRILMMNMTRKQDHVPYHVHHQNRGALLLYIRFKCPLDPTGNAEDAWS